MDLQQIFDNTDFVHASGTKEEWIVLTAHYDTTSLSHGAYDNMSGLCRTTFSFTGSWGT